MSRKLINEKCKSCSYHPANMGTWRQQIGVCPVISCPLWPIRPGPTGVDIPRDPSNVPKDWVKMQHEDAIRGLRTPSQNVPNLETEDGQ